MNATSGAARGPPRQPGRNDKNSPELGRRAPAARSGQAGQEDVPVEEAELTDAQFYRGLRASVEGVRDGTVPSITAAMRPSIKDSAAQAARPLWGSLLK